LQFLKPYNHFVRSCRNIIDQLFAIAGYVFVLQVHEVHSNVFIGAREHNTSNHRRVSISYARSPMYYVA